MVQPLWKVAWHFLKKLKIELPYDLAIPPLGIYSKELKAEPQKDVCTSTFIAALFKIAKTWKQPKCPWTNEMDKQNVVYTYNEMLFSLKKKGNSDVCYNMSKHHRHCAKWNKPVTKRQILYDFTYIGYLK